MTINEKYLLWCEKAVADEDLQSELCEMSGNDNLISDAFYKDLEFGTAGLRGIIGAGTNRMNIYTVGKASQGLAEYVNSVTSSGKIAIAFDSRIKSDVFAKASAAIFAANGIKVYLYKKLMPTPMLSFAVRRLCCDAGVVVTASHNPSKYNGYKAYGPDGSQLNPKAADYVLSIMNTVDPFKDIKTCDFNTALESGIIEYISDDIINEYYDCVISRRVTPSADLSGLKIVYTPLNGAGNKPVREIFRRIGVKNVAVVKEQELPDGNFPTAPFPNPEIKQALEYALKLAETENPDVIIATDPDSDRIGTAVKSKNGYTLISGNDMGVLMLNFVLERRKAAGTLPPRPLAVKTIVSSELCARIAEDYGCELKNVLTGFKFIGEQITLLENKNDEDRFVFGYEESYGYLAGSYARDKDAVGGSVLVCEMTAYYKKLGKTLLDALDDIYKKYGYYLTAQQSFVAEGQSGMERIKAAMSRLRQSSPLTIAESDVIKINDYQLSVSHNTVTGKDEILTLPKSDVLCFFLKDGSSFIVRPSGTEPKIKLYVCAVDKNKPIAEQKRNRLIEEAEKLLDF